MKCPHCGLIISRHLSKHQKALAAARQRRWYARQQQAKRATMKGKCE